LAVKAAKTAKSHEKAVKTAKTAKKLSGTFGREKCTAKPRNSLGAVRD